MHAVPMTALCNSLILTHW